MMEALPRNVSCSGWKIKLLESPWQEQHARILLLKVKTNDNIFSCHSTKYEQYLVLLIGLGEIQSN